MFFKIFEKIVFTRLFEYLDVNHILCNSQFGFRQKMSTYMALLELTDVIIHCMDSRNFTIEGLGRRGIYHTYLHNDVLLEPASKFLAFRYP